MIIDTHVHFFGNREWWPEWAWTIMNKLQGARFKKSPEEMEIYRGKSFDPSGNPLIENMDRAGVDKAVVCVADFGLAVNNCDTLQPIEKINVMTHEIVNKHSDRLYFGVGVDPRRENAVEVLDLGINELDAKSLKLYPGAGWYPNDKIAYKLYERCSDYGIPVNFHTGAVFGPMKSKFSHPIHIDEVASDFPDLSIYCTHAGFLSFLELVSIARIRPNIVLDMAGWVSWFHCGEARNYYKVWRFITNMIGFKRVLFASDHTGFKYDPNVIDEYVELVDRLKEIPKEYRTSELQFTDDEMEAFFFKNAMRVFKLN